MHVKILGSGKYLPKRIVLSSDMDTELNLPIGTIEQKTGVRQRHQAGDETLDQMAAKAAKIALDAAGLRSEDVGLIVSAGASPLQLIPCNAVFYQRALGLEHSGIPAFDLDATCLSFMVALEFIGAAVASGRYKNALIISSEMASLGINWNHLESGGLFGDGAAAFVIGPTPEGERSHLLASKVETFSTGARLCQIVGGGSVLPGYRYTSENHGQYLFQMDGKQLFKQALMRLPPAVERTFAACSPLTMDDVAMVIPHQASLSAMTLLRRRLGIKEERLMQIIETHGNCIAASIPMALHDAISAGKIRRGDLALLIGTGAGLSVGVSLLRY